MFRIGQSSLTCCGSSHSASTPLSLLAPTRRMLSRTSRRRVGEVHHAALAEQEVVLELLREDLPELEGVLVDRRALVPEVVGADDRGVAGHVAAGEPALLQDGDVGHAVVLGQVVGGGQAVPAAADDHDVVGASSAPGCARGSRGARAGRRRGCRRRSAHRGVLRPVRVERVALGQGGDPARRSPVSSLVSRSAGSAAAMMSATSAKSSSPKPRVARAGVPIRGRR